MSAAAGPQAHSPTQAELEKEYIEAQGALRPSFLLLSKPEYITTKREDFRYALRRTLPRFFEMLRGLRYDGFPVQRPPLVIVGGVAVSLVSPLPLNTPDLDIELNGFNLAAAGSQANADIDLRKPNNNSQDFVVLFNRYVYSVMDQLAGMIEQTPEAFDHYDEVNEKDINFDPEVRGGLISDRKAGPFWICLLHPPKYFPKIIILAKIGETLAGKTPNVERVMELKLPAKIFKPLDPAEFLVEREGLVFASPAKMMPDLVKSLGDKCVALTKLSKKYDGPAGTFAKSLEHDGYWDVIEEPRDREAILTYKVRIITLHNRIAALGGNPNLDVCKDYAGLEVLPYVPTAELRDKSLRKARKAAAAAAEKEALAAAEREKVEEIKRQKEQQRLAAATAKAAEEAEAKRIADAKAAKAAAKAKAKQEGRVSPDSAPVVALAEEAASAAVAGPKEIIKNNGFIYFTEGFSIDPSAILNDLYTTLQINFPIAGIPEPPVLLLELNSTDRYRLAERAPLHPKIIHIMDDDTLNQAETIACRIIPDLFLLNTIDQTEIKSTLSDIAHHLTISTWDIQDTQLRKKFMTSLGLWSNQVDSMRDQVDSMRDFRRENMKSSFRFLLKTSVEIFDILCQQVHHQKRSNYTVADYDNKDLLSVHKGIDSYLSQIEPKRFTATMPVQAVIDLRNQFEGLYCQSKVKNLLFTLDAAYPTYATVIDKRHLLKPVMLIGHSSYLSLHMINLIQQFCTKAGIQKIAGTYSRTSEFLGIGEMAKTPCQASLLGQLYEKLRGGHEERGLNLEITLQKSRHLWFSNTAILNEVCQLVTLLLQRDKFITCNREHFWTRFSVNTEPIPAFLAPYERFTEEQTATREQTLDTRFVDAEFAAKQKLVLEQEEIQKAKQKEAINKDIEQRIKTIVELTGMSVDEAALQVAQNMGEAEGAGGPSAAGAGSGGGSKKAGKGKGKRRTMKNRRI